jgi:hypothetical protein
MPSYQPLNNFSGERMSPLEFEKWLTKEEASNALAALGVDVKPRTLQDKASRGLVPHGKPNGKLRFRLSELLRFFNQPATASAED